MLASRSDLQRLEDVLGAPRPTTLDSPMSTSPRPSISFEFFPTKTDAGHEKLLNVARQLAGYQPDFFSCT